MIDDLESNMQIDNIESTSDKFPMIQSKLPGAQQDINILSMSTSKKNLYLVTDRGEILCIDSKTLTPIQQSFQYLHQAVLVKVLSRKILPKYGLIEQEIIIL